MEAPNALFDWWDEACQIATDRGATVLPARSVALGSEVTLVTLGEHYRQAYESLLDFVDPKTVIAWAEVRGTISNRFELFPHHLMLGAEHKLAVCIGNGEGAPHANNPR